MQVAPPALATTAAIHPQIRCTIHGITARIHATFLQSAIAFSASALQLRLSSKNVILTPLSSRVK
jgi:hypothetical protein